MIADVEGVAQWMQFGKWFSGVWRRSRRDRSHTGPEGEALEDNWRREKAGTPLTLRAGCVQFRGDWPWLCFVFGFLGHAATQFCLMCAAAFNEHTPMTDVSAGARWRARCWCHRSWLENRVREGLYISRVFSWPGFLFSYITLDWMHDADMGVVPAEIGEVWWSLLR